MAEKKGTKCMSLRVSMVVNIERDLYRKGIHKKTLAKEVGQVIEDKLSDNEIYPNNVEVEFLEYFHEEIHEDNII